MNLPFGNASREDVVKQAIIDRGLNEINLGDPAKHNMAIRIGYFIIGVLFCILVWQLFASYYNAFMAKNIFFPTPSECFERIYIFFAKNYKILGTTIMIHMQYSMKRWIEGFFIAAIIGVFFGVAMSMNDRIYRFGMVPISVLQMIPGLAWYPVCILLFGLGEKSALFIIAITVISPIAINVCNGLRRVPKVNMRVADMCGKNYAEKFVEILLPFAALDFIAGFRVGMANAWRMLISAEMVVGVAVGLGYAIQITTSFLDYVSAFACIVIICTIGIVIDKVVFASIESYASKKLGVGSE